MLGNPAWLFTIATVIACIGIIIIFRKLMGNLIELIGKDNETELLQKEMISFFLKVAVLEVAPIILLIIGISKMNKFNGSINEMIIPLILIGVVFLFSLLVVFFSARQVQNMPNVDDFLHNQISSFMMMGIAISSTFPLIAFIMIYLAG